MTNLGQLQNFLKQRIRRSQGPDTSSKPESLSDAEMAEGNAKALEQGRADSETAARRASLEAVTRQRLEDNPEIPAVQAAPKRSSEVAMMKEGGGGGGAGGAGGAGGLAGGGTVAVASDPGVFTPTYGGGSKRRLGMSRSKKDRKSKKKKKDKYQTSGVTKLDRFLRGEKINQISNSDSVSVTNFAAWLVDDVRKALRPENRDTTYGTGVNEPPTTGTHRGKVRNPNGRGGMFRALHGQQGYTMDFKKMDTIANTISSGGSVLDLIKAIDIDIPDELD